MEQFVLVSGSQGAISSLLEFLIYSFVARYKICRRDYHIHNQVLTVFLWPSSHDISAEAMKQNIFRLHQFIFCSFWLRAAHSIHVLCYKTSHNSKHISNAPHVVQDPRYYYQSNLLIYLFVSQRLRWRVWEIKLLC